MTFSVDRGAWLFRHYDTYDDETPYRFRFVRWVESAGRDDLAAVEILDEWNDYKGRLVSRAVLAARHVGYDLRAIEMSALPVHVHIMTTPPEADANADPFDVPNLVRMAWATAAPVDVPLSEPQAFQAFTVRPDPSAR
jgi:hypothetical protein